MTSEHIIVSGKYHINTKCNSRKIWQPYVPIDATSDEDDDDDDDDEFHDMIGMQDNTLISARYIP